MVGLVLGGGLRGWAVGGALRYSSMVWCEIGLQTNRKWPLGGSEQSLYRIAWEPRRAWALRLLRRAAPRH